MHKRGGIAAAMAALTAVTGSCGTTDDDDKSGIEPVEVLAPAKDGTWHADWRGVPLQDAIERGLEFLASSQSPNGGYGQDGRDPRSGTRLESQGQDVANTAMVALALIRAGTSPTDGRYTDCLLGAVNFILESIEKAPAEGLAVTDRTGTQIQRKLGANVDTFLSAMVLTELKGRMPDDKGEARLEQALAKCIAKIEAHQGADGSWNSGNGWAPVISTSLASRSLFEARSKGMKVSGEVLRRVDELNEREFDRDAGSFDMGRGSAGVQLYKVAQAYEQATRTEESVARNEQLVAAAEELFSSERFQAGFGSMGGEEFISYMNISDSLARKADDNWRRWNVGIKERLLAIQNEDGSWAGHHCITGRIACTSGALITLLTERSLPRAASAAPAGTAGKKG